MLLISKFIVYLCNEKFYFLRVLYRIFVLIKMRQPVRGNQKQLQMSLHLLSIMAFTFMSR